jgi:hypothetical protein
MRKLRRILSLSAFAFVVTLSTAFTADGFANDVEAAGVGDSGDTEAATEPWYTYNGHTGYNQDGDFILDPLFVDAVKHQNFTINGYQIDGSEAAMNEHGENHQQIDVSDQQVLKYDDGQALGVYFPVNSGAVSKDELFDVYGETDNAAPSDPDEVAYYNYQLNDQRIQFVVRDNWVTEVRYGGDLMNHS